MCGVQFFYLAASHTLSSWWPPVWSVCLGKSLPRSWLIPTASPPTHTSLNTCICQPSSTPSVCFLTAVISVTQDEIYFGVLSGVSTEAGLVRGSVLTAVNSLEACSPFYVSSVYNKKKNFFYNCPSLMVRCNSFLL